MLLALQARGEAARRLCDIWRSKQKGTRFPKQIHLKSPGAQGLVLRDFSGSLNYTHSSLRLLSVVPLGFTPRNKKDKTPNKLVLIRSGRRCFWPCKFIDSISRSFINRAREERPSNNESWVFPPKMKLHSREENNLFT